MHAYYGLSLPRKLWVMGYKGFMGYVGDFPASQLGRWDFLWVMGGYGLREVWVMRVSTVRAGYVRAASQDDRQQPLPRAEAPHWCFSVSHWRRYMFGCAYVHTNANGLITG